MRQSYGSTAAWSQATAVKDAPNATEAWGATEVENPEAENTEAEKSVAENTEAEQRGRGRSRARRRR